MAGQVMNNLSRFLITQLSCWVGAARQGLFGNAGLRFSGDNWGLFGNTGLRFSRENGGTFREYRVSLKIKRGTFRKYRASFFTR
jgi:hypothetical protein